MRGIRSCGLVVVFVVAMLVGCGKREEKPPAPPPILQPAPPLATNAAQPVKPAVPEVPLLTQTVAELEGSAETPVVAPSSGYLVKQVDKENAMVATGDVLFIMDPRSTHPDPIIPEKNDLGLVMIVAPSAGAMGRALHGAGDWINAHDQLAAIATVDPIRAVFSVPHGTVLARQAFELMLEDGSVYPAKGRLESITAAGTNLGISVVFLNPDHTLRPGQFVKVRGIAP